MNFKIRINKYLADRGVSTRRGADALIVAGKVFINGKRAEIGARVLENDKVEIKGAETKTYQYIAYHKPTGVITHSPQGEEIDIQKSTGLKGLFPIGRLDKASSGLIILTNDGRITDRLLNPNKTHDKEYKVRSRDELPARFKERMEKGVYIEGYKTKPCTIKIVGEKTFFITLTEGKKHQIRRMCAALSVVITELERVRIMNIHLGSLKKGQHRFIEGAELKGFLRSLGL